MVAVLKTASRVFAHVFCGTLAARDLTGSFLSAAPSLAPAAALWLAWKLAVCLQAAFPCRSPPKHKDAFHTSQVKSLV